MTIRSATVDDLPGLAHVMAIVFGKTPKREYIYDGPQPPEIMAPFWYNDFVKQFLQPHFRFVIVEQDDKLLGGAVWELQSADAGKHYGYPLEAADSEGATTHASNLLNKRKLRQVRSALRACTPNFQHDLSEPAIVDLAWIAVLPSAQGQGIGSALIAQAKDYYRSPGHAQGHTPSMVVLSHADKISWYEKHGFHVYCELVNTETAKVDVDMMTLKELLPGAKWLIMRPEPSRV